MSRRRTRAFTLIELLVVILIIAVVAAVIVPAFAGFYDKARFDAEIRRVEDYFAVAREKAVKGDTTVTLHFERTIHELSMTIDPLPPQNDLPTAMLTAETGQVREVVPYHIADDYQVENFQTSSAGGNSGGSGSDITFHGDGTADAAQMDIVSRQGYTAHLVLSPMNGRLALDLGGGQAQ